jgi:hypothetical protein
VQVAVPGVEHVGDADPGRLRQLRDRAQHLRQGGAGDDAVLHDVVGADPPDRCERGLAALPDQRALRRVGGHAELERLVLAAQPLHLRELVLDLDGRPVELDHQHRSGAGRVVAVHGGLGRLDRQRVHHLDRRRHDPRGDDRRRGGTGVVGGGEPGQQRAHLLGVADQPDGDRRGHAQRALGADHRAQQVVARAVGGQPAQLDHVAVRRDQLGAEHVVGGEAVLQAVRAAGVLREVAADRADLLAGGVRRVVVAVRRRGPRHVEVDHPRLHDRALVVAAYLPDRPHPRGHDEHPVGPRQRPSGQPGAGAPRHERQPVLGARADHGGELLGGLGDHHQPGGHLVVGETVALVGPQPGVVGDHPGLGDHLAGDAGDRVDRGPPVAGPAGGRGVLGGDVTGGRS